jgi:acid phosphatase type 7
MPTKGKDNRRFSHPDMGKSLIDELKTTVDHTPYHNDSRFEDFPPPPGDYPYHLDLADLLHEPDMSEITKNKELVFHVAGDTGNDKNDLQLDVAELLKKDAETSNPKFFYHLGDVVYDFGEDREYPDQFYEIYKGYSVPIVAIPGNHDGAEFSGGPDSLVGFMSNFCDRKPQLPNSLRAIGVDFGRDTMTQPNCYWTLDTPYVTIIGLYTNVPSGGIVREPQVSWFNEEMKKAPKNKKLIVTMHHPVFSMAQGSHRGSVAMQTLLMDACKYSQRVPDLVLAGHVHNYQRFTTKIQGKSCVFVVVGCGGHAIDKLVKEIRKDTPVGDGVTANFASMKYVGFLRCTANRNQIDCEFMAVNQGESVDSFSV